MNNRLSNTSVDKYIECSLCYKLHYVDKVRPKYGKSALLFGKALDAGLNELLLTKDLYSAISVFEQNWENVVINGEKIYAPTSDLIKYFKSDLDEELLEYAYGHKQLKHPEWYTLYTKGLMFIKTYHEKILPKIKDVIAIQESVSLKNTDGDEIYGTLDLIVKWEDGKTYLMDNKSSGSKYEPDSAKKGQQLPLYYYMVKEKYNLDGVGYIVLSKKINKNRKKTCKECGTVCETSHKTCNNELQEEIVNEPRNFKHKRCGGEFNITISPSVDFDVIINTIDEEDEKRVIEKFDEVNYNIANKIFATEHNPNRGKYGWCPYNDYYDGHPDFIILPSKDKKNENT